MRINDTILISNPSYGVQGKMVNLSCKVYLKSSTEVFYEGHIFQDYESIYHPFPLTDSSAYFEVTTADQDIYKVEATLKKDTSPYSEMDSVWVGQLELNYRTIAQIKFVMSYIYNNESYTLTRCNNLDYHNL